jgi:hypothetical protein
MRQRYRVRLTMTSYFDKRKKKKLYQQWVDKSGLPPESVPGDREKKGDFHEPIDGNTGIRRPGIQSGLTYCLTMRHLLYLVLIIIVLLITTVSLATVLIMRSC